MKFAINEELTEEERKRAYSEAPMCAKPLFDALSKVTDEIADVKEQVQVMKDDVNTRINDLFAKTEGTEIKLQGLQVEYEGLRREVETLTYARQTLGEDVNNAVKKLDKIEQYSRRNCLIFTGIKEDSYPSREDTDEVVINIYNTKLGLNITEDSIDRSHRLGRWHPFTSQSQTESEMPKPRAIIVKFMNYHDRFDVFCSKAKLKQAGIAIYENLTNRRLALLNAAKGIVGVKNVWSLDGKTLAMSDGKKVRLMDNKDLEHLQREL